MIETIGQVDLKHFLFYMCHNYQMVQLEYSVTDGAVMFIDSLRAGHLLVT